MWVNHKNISRLPIRQLYIPANMYAIASDHDYLEGSPEDRGLNANYVTKISEDQVKDIESSAVSHS